MCMCVCVCGGGGGGRSEETNLRQKTIIPVINTIWLCILTSHMNTCTCVINK